LKDDLVNIFISYLQAAN